MKQIEECLTKIVEITPAKFNAQYKSPNDYVLQHGHLYESTELTEAEREVLHQLNPREYKIRECYYNAQFIAITFPEFNYVEGLATGVIPVDHAWCELNGKVIDMTWVEQGSPILGVIPEDSEYYGVVLPTEQVWTSIRAHHAWKPLIDDFECRWPMLRGSAGNHMVKEGKPWLRT